MNDNLQVFFKSISSMAVGKASTSRKCRILLGLRSWILILKALSSSCHILLVFMKVVFIHFPWLRWARSEGPAPATEEFPAQQPLPITEFRWQKKAATATPIREFLTTASQHCGSNTVESWESWESVHLAAPIHTAATEALFRRLKLTSAWPLSCKL